MKGKITTKELPREERPYEKCLEKGPETLTDAELLAVILRCGSRDLPSVDLAREILRQCPSREGLLGIHHLSVAQLQEISGVGPVKAVQIKCIGELSKRMARLAAGRKLNFQDPASIASYYMEALRHEEQEILICMMLDTKNHFLGDVAVTRGTVNTSLISPRELFLEALRHHAVHLVLVHNHPSGDPSPSLEDLSVTRRISRAGELLGIALLDHIIIGDRQYISLLKEGFLTETPRAEGIE